MTEQGEVHKEIEEYRELCRLCRTGKLFSVQDWINDGKSIRTPNDHRIRKSAMEIAIEIGFHSLVEVLLEGGFEPDGDALYDAVTQGKFEIVKLLLEHGADPKSIPFDAVVDSANKDLIRFFINAGADVTTGYPFADGFKRAPKLFCGIYKTYIRRVPSLKLQAEIALRHFAAEGKMRGVCLMLWLGADPRIPVPRESDDDEETWVSAMEDAVWHGRLEILQKLKPDPSEDNLTCLLRIACTMSHPNIVTALVKWGADPNAKSEDGESVFRALFWSLQMGLDSRWPWGHSHERAESARRCLHELIRLGMKWKPAERDDVNTLRKACYRMSWGQIQDLLRFFKEHDFCSDDTLVKLLNTPKMRTQIRGHEAELARLIPWFTKWAKSDVRRSRKNDGLSPVGIRF